ncbi:MAG: hypothetical protein J1E80_02115 [Desulfovibrionaceae bacterium]|nr:hypothetical protein [Desulfovibrionaceae bacterium]
MAFQQRFLPWPFFLALAGILFSLWNVLGDPSALCVSDGCALFHAYTVAGVSLWWGGVAGFSLLLILAVPGLRLGGMLCSGLGLGLDCLLLSVMLFTAPCVSCLIIGLLLALTFSAYRAAVRQAERRRPDGSVSPLLALWTLVFIVNAGCLVRDSLDPWALAEPADGSEAAARIYFSPSCAACVSLVRSYDEALSGPGAWCPVAENGHDAAIIADIKRRMDERGAHDAAGLAAALDASLAAGAGQASVASQLRPGALLLQFRLWRNAARVLRAGSARLPFVEFHGAPAALQHSPAHAQKTPRAEAPEARADTLPFLSVNAFCDGEGSSCDESGVAARKGSGSLDSLMRGDQGRQAAAPAVE